MCRGATPWCAMARHDRAAAMVAGARGCIGARFRPQGRGPDGMDCLGVVSAALAAAGHAHVAVPRRYRLSGHDPVRVAQAIAAAGMIAVAPRQARAGDVLVRFPALGQAHFAVCTDGALVEAHVGAGRVVERPWRADEPWHCAWRLPDGADGDGR